MYTAPSQTRLNIMSKLLFVVALAVTPFFSEAFYQTGTTEMNNYAWSSNIGWISMGNGGNEQVSINTNGTVTGYAWSSNIGWIRFGGLSGFPTGGGTTASNAQLVSTGGGNYQLRGWARACAGAANTASCSGGTHPSAGGWDGWIALSGSNHTVVLSSSGVAAGSYAWGGNVVGWIDMSGVTLQLAPTATLTPSGCSIALGDTSCSGSLGYRFSNVTSANNPRITKLIPTPTAVVLSGSSVQLTGNPTMAVTYVPGTNRFRSSVDSNSNLVTATVNVGCIANASPTGAGGVCVCNSGYTQTGNSCTTVQTVMEISAERSLIRQGETVDISIEIAGPSPNCTIAGPGVTSADNPIVNQGPIPTPQTFVYTTEEINNLARFTLTCTGVYPDPQSETTTVQVIPSYSEQ